MSFVIPKALPACKTRQSLESHIETLGIDSKDPYLYKLIHLLNTSLSPNDDLFQTIANHCLRHFYISKGMFAFVSHRWVKPLSEWVGNRSVLEIMSGAGHLAYSLRSYGVNLVATDNYSWQLKHGWPIITPIEQLDAASALAKYGQRADILLISWPYMDSTAYLSIQKFHQLNPNGLIVYIGEGQSGCTADDLFFDHFQDIEDDKLFNLAAKKFQSWPSLNDGLYLGRYSHRPIH